MFTLNEIEEIVLGMAEIVRENRYLRQENEELRLELITKKNEMYADYKESQKSAANALVGALAMSYKESGDLEKAQYFASKIDLD